MLRSSTLPAPTDDLVSYPCPGPARCDPQPEYVAPVIADGSELENFKLKSPLLCSGCSCALIFQGSAAMLVGRCAACVKRDAVAARPSIFKDSCRSGSGLLANGVTVPVRGTCGCGGKLYSRTEVATGQCVDCSIAEQRKALATLAQLEADRDSRTDAEYHDDCMHDAEERAHAGECDPINTLGGSL